MGGAWLKERKVAYWGDLDTWGLDLLGRARERLPNLRALLMTEEVFLANEDQAVTEPVPVQGPARASLTDDEAALFARLRASVRGRLEQEFLPQDLVHEVLREWREEGSSSVLVPPSHLPELS